MDKKELKISPIKYYLQAICDKHNISLKELIIKSGFKYENILRKLKENTLRYNELKTLLNIVNYDLIIIDENNKPFNLF